MHITDEGDRFEGELQDGKYHSQGTLHKANGDALVGIFENGINGNLKYYYKTGMLAYEGGYKDGQRHGDGILYNGDGTGFQGQWKDGQIWSGHGAVVYERRKGVTVKAIGTFTDGRLQGTGKLYYLSGNLQGAWYEGCFKNGNFYGQGTYHRKNGELIVGDFENGITGTLKEVGANGYLKYDGGYKDGKRHGKGILYNSDGSSCQGEWSEGVFLHGQGEIITTENDGVSYKDVGTFGKGGNLQGAGKRFILSGKNKGCRWEGNFIDGALDGRCVQYSNQGFLFKQDSIWVATAYKGVIQGVANCYSSNGNLLFKTIYKNGIEIGPRMTPQELKDANLGLMNNTISAQRASTRAP